MNRAFYEVAVRYSEYGVSDSENSLAYRPVEYGVASWYKLGMIAMKGRTLLNTRLNIWVSNEVCMTRRKQHELDKSLDVAYSFLLRYVKKCKEKFDVAGVIVDAVNKISEYALHT